MPLLPIIDVDANSKASLVDAQSALGAEQLAILESNETLLAWLKSQQQPAWRAQAIQRWLFGRRAASFDDMTDLPLSLRTKLQN